MRSLFLAALFALSVSPASAATPPPRDNATPQGGFAAELPEIEGVVSWKTLARVGEVKMNDRLLHKFSAEVAALDNKEIKLQGFMLPLEAGRRQKHFLLSANVPSCPFCLPGGPDSLIEVHCKEAIEFSMEPIVISGKLSVLKDDPTGLWYRVHEATLVSRARQ